MTRLLFAALALLAFSGCSHYAHETRGTQVGVLRCNALPGTRVSVLITSSVDIECTFVSGEREDHYAGQTGVQLGIDASWIQREAFYFSVLSAVANTEPGFLAGRYVGAKAGATLGLGVGVGTMIGGGEGNITLEPFSLEVSEGIGVAAGLSFLRLAAAPGPD